MPNNIVDPTVYVPEGNPEDMNVPSLPAPGNLGKRFTIYVPLQSQPGTGPVPETGASKSYQIVQFDSGINVSPTRGMVTWWKDKALYRVTNDQLQATNRNSVAGIIKSSVTAGRYGCIQIGGPSYVQVTAADAGAFVSGDSLIPSAADNGRANRVAMGTAVTHTKIGTAQGPVVQTNLILTTLTLFSLEST